MFRSRKRRLFIALLLIIALLSSSVFTFAASSNVKISGYTAPTSIKQGKSFSIKGKLKSNIRIKKVEIGIAKSNGKWTSCKYVNNKVHGKTFNIKRADKKLKFGKLKAGTYYYRINVQTRDGRLHKVVNKKFKIVGRKKSGKTFKLSGIRYPSTIVKGKPFSIKGKIKSTKKIKSVTVGVVNASTKKWTKVKTTKKKIDSNSFNIAKVDSKIKFGKLPVGVYYYRVDVRTSSGTKTVIKYLFNVTEPSKPSKQEGSQDADNEKPSFRNDGDGGQMAEVSDDKIKNVKTETSSKTIDDIDFTLSEIRYPEILFEGDAFGVTGMVIASRQMELLKVGVVNSAGNWMISASQTLDGDRANIFDLDKQLKFSVLKAGTYTYKAVVNIDGKNMTVFSRKFVVKNCAKAQAITRKALQLVWPAGTPSSKYKYGPGKATAAYKAALKQAYGSRSGWGPAPKAGASCDVFVGTVLRCSGVGTDCPRGLDGQFPYFKKTKKFKRVSYSGKRSQLRSGDVIIYDYGYGAHVCLYVKKNGKEYIAEANYKSTYARLTSNSAELRDRTSFSGKKALYIYRAVE